MLVLLRQRETLSRHSQRCGMLRARVVSEVRAPKDRHLLRRRAAVAQSLPSPREHSQCFRRGVAFGDRHCRYERQIKLELFARAPFRRGLRVSKLYSLTKMLHGLGVSRTAEREIAGLEPVINGRLHKSGLREVVRHDLGLA